MDPLTAPRRRPFGVIVVALLQLGTVATAIASYVSDIALPWEGTLSAVMAEHSWARIAILLFALLVVLATAGMWRLQRWGLAMMISLVGLSLVLDITMWASDASADRPLSLYLRMGLDVVSAFYLNSASVQEAFRGRPPSVALAAVAPQPSTGQAEP